VVVSLGLIQAPRFIDRRGTFAQCLTSPGVDTECSAAFLDVTLRARSRSLCGLPGKPMTGAPRATPVIELQTLNEAPLGERHDGTSGDNEVLGGFPMCHPYLHSTEGD
jgi:hypothetical protein